MSKTSPISRVRLRFQDERAFANVNDPIEKDLSALARAGGSLFTCCDETAGVDRLTATGEDWGNHQHFNLGAIFDLPGGPDGEMDIEGLDCDDDWLWIVGSQSLTRGKPDEDDTPQDALKAMARIKRDANRQFIGRVPLEQDGAGLVPRTETEAGPAAHVAFRKGGMLRRWLRKDVVLAPYLDLPSKENGLDIEGIAARGLRVWLGLRGPVFRGMAVVLELEFKIKRKGGHLKARRIEGRRRYRKHLVDTGGQGIRDVKLDGDDLLLLTGPTMAGDGRADILRWRRAVDARASGVVPADQVETLLELPYRGHRDHPEGLVRWPEAARGGWLVVYDSPAEERLGEDKSVTGDIWRLG